MHSPHAGFPNTIQPPGILRDEGSSPDGMTLISWSHMGRNCKGHSSTFVTLKVHQKAERYKL